MSWLMVALIGPGKGPSVPMTRRKALLRVTGQKDGVLRAFVDNELQFIVEANGNYELPVGEFFQAEYSGTSKALIAEIVRES